MPERFLRFPNFVSLKRGFAKIDPPKDGFAAANNRDLPIGLQLLGKSLDEARLLQIAHAYEQSTDWHKARPPI